MSYAGRLVLIRAVLKTYHNYWSTMVILPSGAISGIESICRNYLWDGGVDYIRASLVAWDKVCKPKAEGGLGLKNEYIWNRAAIGKLVWWISSKADHLWVKWVNHNYIKGNYWISYSPSSDTSWYWRKLCQVKSLMAVALQQELWTTQKSKEYTIAKRYDYLRDKGNKVEWRHLVWNSMTIPKHGIISWLYQLKALNTHEKLFRLGISEEDTYYTCGKDPETLEHLFFACDYSSKVIGFVEDWLHISIPVTNITPWRLQLMGSTNKKDIVNAVINSCITSITGRDYDSK